MKIQIQQQSLRLRVDERELSRLLSGAVVMNQTRLGVAGTWCLSLSLSADGGDQIALSGTVAALTIVLPLAHVEALQARLPSRDGLTFHVPGSNGDEHGCSALQLQFDVDVRDSLRERGRSPARSGPSPL